MLAASQGGETFQREKVLAAANAKAHVALPRQLATSEVLTSAPTEGITFLTAILDTRYLGTANTYRYSILDT